MALSSFLNINGYNLPCPHTGFNYKMSVTVNGGRNANNAVIGQRIGRNPLFKFENLEWIGLDPEEWQRILKTLENFQVPVTFEDCRTGKPITITMYHGDITAKPLFVDPVTHKVTKYESCKFNLIDCGFDD